MHPGLEEKFAAVLAAAHALLAPLGFRKRRHAFRKRVGPNIAVLEFQRSMTNDEGRLRFTINVAILSAALAATTGREVARMGASEGHLRERIGFLMAAGDKWWTLERDTDASIVADEIVTALREKAVPCLDAYSTDAALRQLWESGRSPGLTAMQRDRFLAALGG